jgi:hypothetical protein
MQCRAFPTDVFSDTQRDEAFALRFSVTFRRLSSLLHQGADDGTENKVYIWVRGCMKRKSDVKISRNVFMIVQAGNAARDERRAGAQVSDKSFTSTRLRVGGWLPSYRAAGRHAAPDEVIAPLDDEPVDTAPPVVPPAAGRNRREGEYWPLQRLVLAGAIVLGLMVVLAVVSGQGDETAPSTPYRTAKTPARATNPNGPVIPTTDAETPGASPSAETTSPAATTAGGAGGGAPATATVVRTGPATTGPGPTYTVTDVTLASGARVGLAPVNRTGYRVRQRNFVGRVDPIGANSSASDKDDATFTVRPGLADSRCFSFESVNHPWYYLRHRNFRIYLQPVDGTALFAADTTFCPVTGLTGQHTSLQAFNYPDYYVCQHGDDLYLDPGRTDNATRTAMTFIVVAGF